jgi:hypothetical protein
MSEVFWLSAPSSKAIFVLLLLGIAVPVGALLIALVFSKSTVNLGVLGVILLAALLPTAILFWTAFARRTVEVTSTELVVKSAFYTAKISTSSIGPNLAIVNAENFPGGGIAMRSNGIGLPNYQVGWFSLKNGRSVFLVYTGGNALYIPTNTKFDLVLDVIDANTLLNKLKASKDSM